ncbi:glutathione ABC transporter permease [Reticulibacter mediterranei]|uniref:Glutathione ABC transporter permease n=1 Tax=Reticulibacter mediterranei TaxID=2778369 RepID=A0A8J3IMD6_9CHLR|nr:ABC transporter permease [Reticulibacter mediterranei]GHO95075.1 glutathione ABC transporter permease [Reticulibacter mediterranei]
MIRFFVKRLLGLIFVIIGVTFITFIMGYFAPGDPIRDLMGEKFNYAIWLRLRHDYGLDLPWYQQYFHYLSNLLHFNLGTSYHFQNRAVWDILKEGVPISSELVFWGFLLQLVLGIPLGIISALRARTWVDTVNMTVMLTIYALPSFVLAVFAQILVLQFNKVTGIEWPVSQWGAPWQYDWTDFQYKLVPILVFGAAGFAYFSRLTRTSLLEVLGQDYVRTARAKGLLERVVVYRHAFRNALIPLVTVIGLSFGLLVAGSFFIEQIFNIPGIARITINSIYQRDYPVIQATTMLIAIGVVFGNLLSDVLYAVVDPRIKVE